MGNFLADEEPLDRRAKWRLASWGTGAVAALVVALLASQTSMELRRDQLAAADLMARQSQQIQSAARENHNEARRLASAIDTLNSDRDRLFSRVSSVEKNLDSMTGSIARQSAAASSVPAMSAAPLASPQIVLPPAPAIASVESVAAPDPVRSKPQLPAAVGPATVAAAAPPSVLSKAMLAPPDPAAVTPNEPPPTPALETTASLPSADVSSSATETAPVAVQRTEFGIDLGGANTVDGLRALWRGLSASHKALAGLRPIIVVKERTSGLGMQLRLVAGPLGDAAAAAKLCATMTDSERGCETSVFDGQRLALKSEAAPYGMAVPTIAPAPSRSSPRKKAGARLQQ